MRIRNLRLQFKLILTLGGSPWLHETGIFRELKQTEHAITVATFILHLEIKSFLCSKIQFYNLFSLQNP